MKKCNKCLIEKVSDEFSADRYQKDGRGTTCKQCKREYMKTYAKNRNFEVCEDKKVTRVCTDCHLERSIIDFDVDRRKSKGRAYRCKECQSAFTACKRSGMKYHVKKKYKISLEEYDKWMSIGKCAICGETEKLRLDHDHATGKIRGCLCHRCNIGLGGFRDNCDLLQLAAAYLKEKAATL